MKILAMGSANAFALLSQIFANLLLGGLLERFPKLTFVGAESGIGWVPYVLEACDYEWELNELYKNGLKRKPSDAFRQQCYVDFWYEQAGIKLRDYIGVDRILWETDFPHRRRSGLRRTNG
jgi:predicted TIM-barrel fold metal-dependent hydrolase